MNDAVLAVIDWLRADGEDVAEMRRLLIAHQDDLARDIAIGVNLRHALADAIERGAHL